MSVIVKFHLPYNYVATEVMAETEARALIADIMVNRRRNSVKANGREYFLNPELVTHAEMETARSF